MKELFLFFITAVLFSGCSAYRVIKQPVQEEKTYKSSNNYQQDFLYLTYVLENNYPHFKEEIPQDDYFKNKEDLLRKFGDVTNIDDFKLDLLKYIASFKNTHTRLLSPVFRDTLIMPIKLYSYDGKWYVVDADKRLDKNLIGGYVLSINDIDVNLIDSVVSLYIPAENKYWTNMQIADKMMLQRPIFLRDIGICDLQEQYEIRVLCADDSIRKFTITPEKTEKIKWRGAVKRNDVTYFRDEYANYYEVLPDNIMYFQMNTCWDLPTLLYEQKMIMNPAYYHLFKSIIKRQIKKEGKSFISLSLDYGTKNFVSYPDFLNGMFDTIHKEGIDDIIIDVRYNLGGSLVLYSLLDFLKTDSVLSPYSMDHLSTDYIKKRWKKAYRKGYWFYSKVDKGDSLLVYDAKFTGNDERFYEVKNSDKIDDRFDGHIYIITGSKSHSGGSFIPTLLKDYGLATIVGMPPANRPSGPSSSCTVILPNSKLELTFSEIYLHRPDESKEKERILQPDQFIQPHPDDLFSGYDPALDWILNDIKSSHD